MKFQDRISELEKSQAVHEEGCRKNWENQAKEMAELKKEMKGLTEAVKELNSNIIRGRIIIKFLLYLGGLPAALYATLKVFEQIK